MLHVDEIYHIIKTRLYMKTLIPIYVMILCLFNYQPGYIYIGEKRVLWPIFVLPYNERKYITLILDIYSVFIVLYFFNYKNICY